MSLVHYMKQFSHVGAGFFCFEMQKGKHPHSCLGFGVLSQQ